MGALLDDAYERGVLKENSIVYRDLFDTRLMGALTPRPAQVIEKFNTLYRQSPKEATDWYYQFSQDTNYIRRDRIARDVQWKTMTEYGELDITSTCPSRKRTRRRLPLPATCPASNYPRASCARRMKAMPDGSTTRPPEPPHRADHHQRLAVVPAVFALCLLQRTLYLPQPRARPDEDRPRLLWQAARLCAQFPHYFVGSNADLPIVGGSILAHDHFQGGHYTFAMEKAPGGDAGLLCRL